MAAMGRKFDVAERDARNRALGKAGEECVLHHERQQLCAAGRDDLADKVRWTAVKDGDGFGFDILSFEADGREKLIEVKTTNGWERTPFTYRAMSLRLRRRGRRNGASCASGTLPARPARSRCTRRSANTRN
jgi:hypothetical protein